MAGRRDLGSLLRRLRPDPTPSVGGGPALRRTGSTTGGTTPDRFPPSLYSAYSAQRGRRPAPLLQPRSPVRHRPSPRAWSSPPPAHAAGYGAAVQIRSRGRALLPPHIRQIRAGSTLKEVLTLVHYSRYTFSSCLPDPNRLTVPTRPNALGAASRPSPAPPDPDYSQLQRTAVTAHWQGSRTLTRKHIASWRTLTTWKRSSTWRASPRCSLMAPL